MVKCDVRLPYRMYVASLHFVFTLFGVSCRENFERNVSLEIFVFRLPMFGGHVSSNILW